MKFTENFKLKKPEQTDSYNVEDFNENADVIDAKLKELADLLTVEDISSDFLTRNTAADVTATKISVFKQGNFISGSIDFTGDFPNVDGAIFDINSKYKPRQHTITLPVGIISEGSSPADSARVEAYIESVDEDDEETTYLCFKIRGQFGYCSATTSFSYICQ